MLQVAIFIALQTSSAAGAAIVWQRARLVGGKPVVALAPIRVGKMALGARGAGTD
jgi:hypothetical protein